MLSKRALLALSPYFAILLIAMVAATYAFPQTDDFCNWGRMQNLFAWNPFAETFNFYMTWGGRPSAILLIDSVGWLTHVLPLPLQVTYALALIAIIAALMYACFRASTVIAPSIALATIAAVAVVGTMPWKLEGVIWLSGTVVYTVSIIAMLLLIGLVETGRPLRFATVVVLAMAVGFNEFTALAIGIYLGLRFLLNQKEWRAYTVLSIVYVVAFGIALAAPGNFVRSAKVAPPHDLIAAVRMAGESFESYASIHLSSNWFMYACLLLAASAATWGTNPIPFRRVAPAIVAMLAAFPINLIGLPFLMGQPIPGRTLNQAHCFLILGLLFLAAWLGARVGSRAKNSVLSAVGSALLLATGLVALGNPVVDEYTRTITQFGATWRSEQTARTALLMAATGSVAVPPLSQEPGWPPVLRGKDISSDPAAKVNTCTADFYNLDSVITEAPKDKA